MTVLLRLRDRHFSFDQCVFLEWSAPGGRLVSINEPFLCRCTCGCVCVDCLDLSDIAQKFCSLNDRSAKL